MHRLFPKFMLLTLAFVMGQLHGQMKVLPEPIGADVQLDKHMAGLEQTWEVMQSRGVQPQVVMGQLAMPDDETLRRQLQAIQGEFQFENYPKVREFISFFAQRHAREFDAVLGMAQYYQPAIDQVLARNKMPKNLRYLPIALSAMNACAVSEHGATGLWQMNYHIAIRYGLLCDEWVDERRDLERSTAAAMLYLRDLFQQYGDWTLAVTAYINGPAALNRAMIRTGGARNFRSLYGSLPTAARDYVPAFVAACYLAQYQQVLGVSSLKIQGGAVTDRIVLKSPVGFKTVSDVLKIPETQLRQLNPVCRMEMIPGLNVPVQICLPGGFGAKFGVMEDSIYRVEARKQQALQQSQVKAAQSVEPESVLQPNANPAEPPSANTPKTVWTPPAGTVPVSYVIQPGDVLGKIAEEHGVTVSQIMSANSLRSANIRAGDKLTIHVPKSKASTTNLKLPSAEKTPPANTVKSPATSPEPAAFEWYTVKPGDNLWAISRKYPGVTDQEIMKLNGISSDIQPGMKIKIPKK